MFQTRFSIWYGSCQYSGTVRIDAGNGPYRYSDTPRFPTGHYQ